MYSARKPLQLFPSRWLTIVCWDNTAPQLSQSWDHLWINDSTVLNGDALTPYCSSPSSFFSPTFHLYILLSFSPVLLSQSPIPNSLLLFFFCFNILFIFFAFSQMLIVLLLLFPVLLFLDSYYYFMVCYPCLSLNILLM